LAAHDPAHENRGKIQHFSQDFVDAITPGPGITCSISEGIGGISSSARRLLRFMEESASLLAFSFIVRAGVDKKLWESTGCNYDGVL
jgi:hypothetical protein